jgi:hypothetical protein
MLHSPPHWIFILLVMIDFVSATISGCKDTINFSHLVLVSESFKYNRTYYAIDGCEEMQLIIIRNTGDIRLKGSVPYYYQGNNFTFDRKKFVQAIDYINTITNIDFWQSDLDEFEYGVIMEVPTTPRNYIIHHTAKRGEKLLQNERGRDKGKFRWWEDKTLSLKLYDAGRNIKAKQSENRKQVIRNAGWDDNKEYIKFEIHYKQPHLYLNKGRAMKLYCLANPEWEDRLKEDLFEQYQRLYPYKDITVPTDKKLFGTPNIYAHTLTELAINMDYSPEDVKGLLYDTINNANPTLSKSDKDARKREVSKIQGTLLTPTESQWDLRNYLQEAINKTNT